MKNIEKIQELSQKYQKINYQDLELLETLGKGGFGQVIKAFHKRDNEFLALKFIEIELDGKINWEDSLKFNRLLNEKELLEKVSQLNLPSFLSFRTMFGEKDIIYEEGDIDMCVYFPSNVLSKRHIFKKNPRNSIKKKFVLAMEYGYGTMTEVLETRGDPYSEPEILLWKNLNRLIKILFLKVKSQSKAIQNLRI